MTLVLAGLSYRTAPVQMREKFAVPKSELAAVGRRLISSEGLAEVVILSTCNRIEVYAVTENDHDFGDTLLSTLGPVDDDVREHLYFHQDQAAIEHLLRVTSSLDSMVLGETEVIGQVKHAYHLAHGAGLTGSVLNRVFQKAFHAAKIIRSRTSVGQHSTSVGSVAVDVAEKVFGSSLGNSTVLIMGAGKMGEICVRHLAKKGARSVLVANRSFDRAEKLAHSIGGRPVPWGDRMAALAESDIVVGAADCQTSAIRTDDVQAILRGRRERPLFLVDIGVPRVFDTDLRAIEGAYLYNMDDLARLMSENRRSREQEMDACEAIVESQSAALATRLRLPSGDVARQTISHNDPDLQTQSDWLLRGAAACGG